MKTKKNWVRETLNEQGYITRNQCLDKRITRLAAIMPELAKEDGFEYEGETVKTVYGVDYKYTKIPRETLF